MADVLARHGLRRQADLLASIDRASVHQPRESRRELAVLTSLGPALELAAPDASGVRADVGEVAHGADWTQTASYLRHPPSPRFLDRYAHATLAGTPDNEDVAEDGSVSLGLLLLAPQTQYPPHHHPADEIYVPLGPARWFDSTGQRYVERPGGVPVHHVPWQPHAMTTEGRSLLAVYVWTGEVATPSSWC